MHDAYNEIMEGFRLAAENGSLIMLDAAFANHKKELREMQENHPATYKFLRASYTYHKKLITGECWEACKRDPRLRADCRRRGCENNNKQEKQGCLL